MIMALFLSSRTTICFPKHHSNDLSLSPRPKIRIGSSVKCESKKVKKLEIGSPIVIVEAPKLVKTATAIPCLRVNTGFVKPGDVGRIVSRKPKDVWAVRLSIGTYLIDGKYFKPLDIDDQ